MKDIQDISTEELQAELNRRAAYIHDCRESETFRGEREDNYADGSQHIEDGLAGHLAGAGEY